MLNIPENKLEILTLHRRVRKVDLTQEVCLLNRLQPEFLDTCCLRTVVLSRHFRIDKATAMQAHQL